ncbi:hypothetical protein ABZ791_08095 [Streptomyces huasconensis]|uniref:hypothetical protein n=1 Tax=Streptomyces huasconensis TaxID=1854574 RepID=UPI0033D7B444
MHPDPVKPTPLDMPPPLVAVVTSDGRYFLKHGKHPKEVQAEKAAQPPPVPTIDVPGVLHRPHQLDLATHRTLQPTADSGEVWRRGWPLQSDAKSARDGYAARWRELPRHAPDQEWLSAAQHMALFVAAQGGYA